MKSRKLPASNDVLILRAVMIDKKIAELTAERNAVHEALLKRFAGALSSESIVSVHGVAVRKRSNSYTLNPDKIKLLRASLGAEFGLMVRDSGETYVPYDHLSKVETVLHEAGIDCKDVLVHRAKYSCTPAFLARFRKDEKLMNELLGAGILSVDTKVSISITPTTA